MPLAHWWFIITHDCYNEVHLLLSHVQLTHSLSSTKNPNPVISLAFRALEFQLVPVSPCSRLSAAFCLISCLLCIHNASPFCVISWLNLSASTSYDNIIHGENKQDQSQDRFQRNTSGELCPACYCLCPEVQPLCPTSISSH